MRTKFDQKVVARFVTEVIEGLGEPEQVNFKPTSQVPWTTCDDNDAGTCAWNEKVFQLYPLFVAAPVLSSSDEEEQYIRQWFGKYCKKRFSTKSLPKLLWDFMELCQVEVMKTRDDVRFLMYLNYPPCLDCEHFPRCWNKELDSREIHFDKKWIYYFVGIWDEEMSFIKKLFVTSNIQPQDPIKLRRLHPNENIETICEEVPVVWGEFVPTKTVEDGDTTWFLDNDGILQTTGGDPFVAIETGRGRYKFMYFGETPTVRLWKVFAPTKRKFRIFHYLPDKAAHIIEHIPLPEATTIFFESGENGEQDSRVPRS